MFPTQRFLALPFILSLVCLQACESDHPPLTLVQPDSPVDQAVAKRLVDVFSDESKLQLSLSSRALTDEHAVDALLDGSADIALVSNSMSYREGIATVIPMYPTVLHIGQTGERQSENMTELLSGARVFAGTEGSASRVLLQRLVDRSNLADDSFSFVDRPGVNNVPDVFVVFAPISPGVLRSQLRDAPPFTLVGIGSPDSIGSGSLVDAAALINPYFRPFVIPVGTYGELTPEPVLTLAVDKVLLARRDLDRSLVYDLITELLRVRPALAADQPGLFAGLKGDFDPSRSTFVLHAGAQAWLQREAPSVYERYSGVAEVVVTLIVALGSASIAGARIFRMRRKNRIDRFYTEVIRLRSSVSDDSSDAERASAIVEVRNLQNRAFELLVDERLAADDSFRIFLALSNEVIEELGPT